MEDYRVQLDFYDGPMDLLLHLVRREEVDIHDIPIARITEQYCYYVEMLRAIDINLAGEFLVMAAWLMEIKTRMLLPSTLPAGDGEQADSASAGESLVDPRAELVRQLLAYKQFKDLADDLGEAAAEQSLKHPRAGIDWKHLVGQEAEPALDLADVQIWDLFEAFGKLMEQTGRVAEHRVSYDDTPIQEHQADLVDRLTTQGPLAFEKLFEGRNRGEIVGLFLALLELIRQKRVAFAQPRAFGSIVVSLRDPADAQVDAPAPSAEAAGEPVPPEPPIRRPRRKKDDEPVGVTWVEPDEDELLDHGLRAIDQELRNIKMPPDPEMLLKAPANPDQGQGEAGPAPASDQAGPTGEAGPSGEPAASSEPAPSGEGEPVSDAGPPATEGEPSADQPPADRPAALPPG